MILRILSKLLNVLNQILVALNKDGNFSKRLPILILIMISYEDLRKILIFIRLTLSKIQFNLLNINKLN